MVQYRLHSVDIFLLTLLLVYIFLELLCDGAVEVIIIIIIIIIIILKYKDLTIEIQRMQNVKTKVIPVIIGATGTISKLFRKNVSNIPGNHEVKQLQKTAISGPAHILRKVLT